MKQQRHIELYKNYFSDFYSGLPFKVREKVQYVFAIIKTAPRIPSKFLEHISGVDGLYEIRVEFESNIYRIFCCFDCGNIVVLFNAFQKKTQKTDPKEKSMAVKLMKEYFNTK